VWKITGGSEENHLYLISGGEGMDWVDRMNAAWETLKVIRRRRATPYGGGTWAIVKSDGSADTLKDLSGHICDLGLCFGFGADGSNDYMCGNSMG
jgi:AraC family transcriptional regulator